MASWNSMDPPQEFGLDMDTYNVEFLVARDDRTWTTVVVPVPAEIPPTNAHLHAWAYDNLALFGDGVVGLDVYHIAEAD